MSEDSVTEIIQILKTCESRKLIYNTLLRVYSDVITSEERLKQFIDKDGLKCVLEYLSKPNKSILNISLGILANCCGNPKIREKILSENVLMRLKHILSGINEDRIHYRCYKLISNLIHCTNFCSTLIAINVHESIITMLEGKPLVNTQLMAIKTIRLIWTEANNNDKKKLARSNFIKCTLKYLQFENKEVQKSVLKFLVSVSRMRFDLILKQVFEEDVLKHVISKASEFPGLILRIIYYLSEMKYFHFFLAKSGTLETVFEHIRGLNFEHLDEENENTMDLVLRSVYRLCNEPNCREKLCSIPDAFNVLLNIIESCSHIKFKKLSILILASFIYDGYSLRRLVRQRLILVLVKYLQIVISEEGNVPHDKNGIKSDRPCSPNVPPSGRFSPTSDAETSVASSPVSERFDFSPTLSVGSDYSPVYSPVMDDIDDEGEEDYEKLSIDDASSKADSPVHHENTDEVKSVSEEKIFNLLKQLAYINEPQYDLCVQKSWETFLDYLVLVRKTTPQVTSLLCAIAGNNFFFNELLKSHFALTVHKKLCRPAHIDCPSCQEMDSCGVQILARYQLVAESSYGTQIIRNELLKNNCIQDKLALSLTIPHIVRNFFQLEEYCLRYKTLQFIVDSLNDDKLLLDEKIASLYSLSTSLYLENPRIPCNLCKKCDVAGLVKEATINFLLDDGSTVTANKRTLCEKSEFFEAMFRCGFKEANQSTVRLSNITSDCLRVLFRLLYSYCDCIVPRNVIVLLELIVQSDRFMIPALSKQLLNIAMNSRLDHKNCHLIYDWAVEHGNFLPSFHDLPICRNVVKYALTEEDITFSQRVGSFKMLLRSKYKSAVLQDILQVIECQLKCKDLKTKCSNKCFIESAPKRCKLI